jgi:hypothetical protein
VQYIGDCSAVESELLPLTDRSRHLRNDVRKVPGGFRITLRARNLLPSLRAHKGENSVFEQFSYRCWRFDAPLFNPGNYNCRDTNVFDGHTVSALLAITEKIEINATLDGCNAL